MTIWYFSGTLHPYYWRATSPTVYDDGLLRIDSSHSDVIDSFVGLTNQQQSTTLSARWELWKGSSFWAVGTLPLISLSL